MNKMPTFDNHEIDHYRGKFSTPFEMDYDEGIKVEYDDRVYFLVAARVTKSDISQDKKTGDVKRTNTFSVSSAQLMTENDINAAAIKVFMENTAFDLDSLDEDDLNNEVADTVDSAEDDEFPEGPSPLDLWNNGMVSTADEFDEDQDYYDELP